MSEQSRFPDGHPAGFDLVSIGRVGIDLYPLQDRTPLAEVSAFGRYLGGSSANVAVAAARHGRRAALVSRTGDDDFGAFVRSELGRLGVDAREVLPLAEVRTTLAFCEIFPPDRFPLTFYRDPVAPELRIRAEELDLARIASAGVLWMSATSFSADPSREAHHAALEARAGRTAVLDLDHRAGFWPDDAAAARELESVWPRLTIAVGNLEECRIAVGESDPDRAADALLDRGLELAVVKLGPGGVLGATREERVRVPATPVEVVNGLGAGDAFGGALVHALLAGWPLGRLLRFASAAGAIVAGRRECSTAMPTTAEVEGLVTEGDAG
ncbi:MAG: 5-dehydro-2-deoxygluconokinase [Protaetiibacter sp.]